MNISLLGSGWLGFPLAKKLIQQGHTVKASTTSFSKLELLKKTGAIPYQINLTEDGIVGDANDFLKDSEVLIVNIPPGLQKKPPQDFVQKMRLLKEKIEQSSIKHCLYVSSTSVFQDTESFPTYDEQTIPNGKSASAKQLIQVEQLFQNPTSSILRFGGLIGNKRHPITYLAGKKEVKNPKAPVNLIQQQDCINLLVQILEKKAWGAVFHGVYPEHPSRKKYYTKIAENRTLTTPDFEQSVSVGKIIASAETSQQLQYNFTMPLL